MVGVAHEESLNEEALQLTFVQALLQFDLLSVVHLNHCPKHRPFIETRHKLTSQSKWILMDRIATVRGI